MGNRLQTWILCSGWISFAYYVKLIMYTSTEFFLLLVFDVILFGFLLDILSCISILSLCGRQYLDLNAGFAGRSY